MTFRYKTIALILGVMTMLFSTVSQASTCQGVKFNFENSRDAKIKIEKVHISGNGKQWSQNINNKVIFAGESYTTNKLRLDKLDTGNSGTFKVRYKWFDPTSGRWGGEKVKDGKTVRCDDNMTIRFKI